MGGPSFGQRVPREERDHLARLLRELRMEAGLRQEDVAERLGVPQNVLSNLETGQRRLDVLEARLLCAALGLSLTAFVVRLERALGASLDSDASEGAPR